MPPLRIAVSGYYGCGNTGDEAVLAGIVESFRLRSVEAEFTVLSADVADTERRHHLSAIPRMDRAALGKTFRESDLVLSGGGSLLQDTTSLRSLVYYLWVVRFAQKCGAPVVFYAQGIGPLRRAVSRILTRLAADRVRGITVRDEESAELLRRIGVSRPPIDVTADPAFALSAAPVERVDEILATAGLAPDENLIGVALRPWHTNADPTNLTEIVRRTAEAAGRRLLFLPMQPPGDVDLARSAAASLGNRAVVLECPISPQEALGVVGRFSLLVGMRLHALIFAASAGVPIIGLAYDPKVTQLMALAGQSDRCFPIGTASAQAIAESAKEALAHSDGLKYDLRERSRQLREKALSNVDHALLAIRQRL